MAPDNLFETRHLVQRIQNGDTRAIELLYQRYIRKVEAWAHGSIPHAARNLFDTQNIAHDVLVRSILRATEGVGAIRSSFHAYVRQALRNRLIDLSRGPQVHLAEVTESLKGLGLTPLEEMLQEEFEHHVSRAISGLSQGHQTALHLRFKRGLSYRDLASELGVRSEDAARMRVNRALSRLREELSAAD